MSRCVKEKSIRIAALGVVAAASVLAGCSDIYYDRRETVASGAGDAVASNIAVQTVDPWPRNVGNTQISMNGDRAVLAAQRYRTNRVITPRGNSTSSTYETQQQQPQQQAPASTGGGAPSAASGQVR
jgi:hypothetical protein